MFRKVKYNHFIVAAPRSGTTWISKMLNAHPNVYCVERRLFGEYADFVLDGEKKSPRLRVTLDKYASSLLLHHGNDKKEKNKLLNSLITAIKKEEKRSSGKKIIIDKITPYLNTSLKVIDGINTFFPKSKIIYLVRDGRDVLTSGVFHWFNKQSANSDLTLFEKERRISFLNGTPIGFTRFFQDKEIEQWANEWIQPLQTIENAKKNHDVKIIFYEDLLKDTKGVFEDCLKFFSAKQTKESVNRCVEAGSFKSMSKGREKGQAQQDAHVRKGISGDWNNYFTYQDAKLFNEIAGEYLIRFGYETKSDWIERLR